MSYVEKLRNKVNGNYSDDKIPINIQSKKSTFASKIKKEVEIHRNKQTTYNIGINLYAISLGYKPQIKI